MYLVMFNYNFFCSGISYHLHTSDWTFQKLKKIGEGCRFNVNESLRTTLEQTLRRANNPVLKKTFQPSGFGGICKNSVKELKLIFVN